ncbi:MAG: substrate-binding domain-containing protein, partial [Bifidobacteriaceae bacterium]|nr:substrate-binding domain-containing protein [Bifidobacteriaceae bacterium]
RYLASIGHKDFMYIGEPDYYTKKEWGFDTRALGYKDTVDKLGLNNLGMITIDTEKSDTASQIISMILNMDTRPTAICTWCDTTAFHVIRALESSNIRVPQDISVAGFDGSNIAQVMNLTGMVPDSPKDIGQLAAQKTLALIRGEDLAQKHTILQAQLHIGSSTRVIHEDQ